jgi:hypothetical protein
LREAFVAVEPRAHASPEVLTIEPKARVGLQLHTPGAASPRSPNFRQTATEMFAGPKMDRPGTHKVTRPIMHVGVDVRRQAARRRRAFDLAVERFAVERFAVILRRALPERFAAVFGLVLRAGFAFLFAVLAMFSLSHLPS